MPIIIGTNPDKNYFRIIEVTELSTTFYKIN